MSARDRRYEQIDPLRRYERRDAERFDRLEFALRALRLLRPEGMTVAVYPGQRELSVQRGRDRARGPAASWATVGIPPHASRESIALALAELAGVAEVPYLVAVLLSADRQGPA